MHTNWACTSGSTHSRLNAERDAQSDVVVQLESLLRTQGFLKRILASKSPHIRTAAYTLIAHLCYRYAPPNGLMSSALLELQLIDHLAAAGIALAMLTCPGMTELDNISLALFLSAFLYIDDNEKPSPANHP